MAKVKLPAGPTEVTSGWLTNALRESGTIREAAVTGISKEIIGEGVGVLGQLARFTLEYDCAEPGAPRTLVGKFPAAVQENRDLANLFRFYEREVRFYERIAEEVELRTPKHYYSHFDEDTNDFVPYDEEEYAQRVGWGHSTPTQSLALARAAGAKRLVTFHHDPNHDDDRLDTMTNEAARDAAPVAVHGGMEGDIFDL